MLNDVVWEKLEGHSHVLVQIEWCFERHVFYNGPTKFGSWRTDYTVPHNFCGDHIGSMCSKFVRIINKISTNRDSYSIWIVFLWVVVDDNSCVREHFIFRDVSDFIMREVEDCVGANRDTVFALCKAM